VPALSTSSGKKRVETYRLKRLTTLEFEIQQQGFQRVAAVDEAGRGPLAGPVVAAACVLPESFILRGINDSKKLTSRKRYRFYQDLMLEEGVLMGVGVVEAIEIDQLNIHNATLEAMRRAVERLPEKPDFLLVDGKFVPPVDLPGEGVVHGDRRSQAIAAASILAKVTRDHIMIGYDTLYPGYGFVNHKGYGTKYHLSAILQYGPCPIHRMTFKGVLHD
jgi:ribonuclease HII